MLGRSALRADSAAVLASRVAPPNSLRDLRSLRSPNVGESAHEARTCGARRPTTLRSSPTQKSPRPGTACRAGRPSGLKSLCVEPLSGACCVAVVGCGVRERICGGEQRSRKGGEPGRARVPAHSGSPGEPAGHASPAVDVWRDSDRPANAGSMRRSARERPRRSLLLDEPSAFDNESERRRRPSRSVANTTQRPTGHSDQPNQRRIV